MARFRFRLATVLSLREKFEMQEKEKLAEAQRLLLKENEIANQMAQERRDIVEYGRSIGDVHMRNQVWEYLGQYDTKILQQQERVKRAERLVEEAVNRWTKAKQDWEILDRIRERHFEMYRLEQNRLEQNAQDEIAVQLVYQGDYS